MKMTLKTAQKAPARQEAAHNGEASSDCEVFVSASIERRPRRRHDAYDRGQHVHDDNHERDREQPQRSYRNDACRVQMSTDETHMAV
jgi:hypothetical protein